MTKITIDRELLELAAKAAGIPPALYETRNGMVWESAKQVWRRAWNPLADDGDALRLAVKLMIEPRFTADWVITGSRITGKNAAEIIQESLHGDPLAATRRAIVRAAAEIGRSMT